MDFKVAKIYALMFLALGSVALSSAIKAMEKKGKLNEQFQDALERLDFTLAKDLLNKGANIECRSVTGKTPLINECGVLYRMNIIQFLIKNGAAVNVEDNYGTTPLSRACGHGALELVKYLINNGAAVNGNKKSWAPLHAACTHGYLELVKHLIEKGANVNVKDMTGSTPLHQACFGGKLEIVKYLIEKGADVNVVDTDGNTPLIIMAGNKEVTRCILYAMNTKKLSDYNRKDACLKPIVEAVEKDPWNQEYFTAWCLRDLRLGKYAHISQVWEKVKDKESVKKCSAYPLLYTIFDLFGKNKISPQGAFDILFNKNPENNKQVEIVRKAGRVCKKLNLKRLGNGLKKALLLIERDTEMSDAKKKKLNNSLKDSAQLPSEILNYITQYLV